jgi:hypothetical protein
LYDLQKITDVNLKYNFWFMDTNKATPFVLTLFCNLEYMSMPRPGFPPM